MMLTIHGLPSNTTYQDLKRLIKQECNITDFILDNLVMDDDGCKKVRIGVSDDSDGSQLMKCLNGYHLLQHVIRIVPIGKPGQQNHYDARGNYQPRNDYNQGHNFGNRPMGQDVQRVSSWVPNVQWEQPMPAPVQNTFPNQPQPIQNNAFVPQGPRGAFIPARVQGFGYQPKHPIPDRPMAPMKDNFHGPGQFEHQAPVPQVPFQAQAHVQPQPWNPQVAPVKPQQPAPGGYNQMPFNDNRQMPKPGMMNEGYKDYDKGDRRFEPQVRGPSPRRRMSPGPHGRRMSPPGLQGRRMSPPGPQGRRMSPPGPQGRRMSPPGPQGRRMSPPGPQGRRMSPPGLQGRRMSPPGPQGRRMSPGPHGRRMSPPGPLGRTMSPGPHGRKMSPPGPHGRRISPPGPHGRRMSPPGPHGRRVSPPGPHGRRMSPPGPHARRMSPPGPHGRRMSPPGPHGRRMSPPGPHGRRMSPPGQQGRRMSPGPQGRRSPSDLQGRRISPTAPHGRRMSPGPQARRMSPGPLGPTGRRISPPGPHHGLHGRRLSPTGPSGPPVRRISPGHQGRRMSPSRMGSMQLRAMSPGHGRKMSPSGYGRRVSPNVPHGQRMDPHGVPRRMSPTDRRLQGRQSPGRRGSPRRMSPKRHSPGRRSLSPRHRSPLLEQPGIRGYQPSFHQSKKPKYEDDDRPSHLKQVRPAYEPPTKAPNQAMYSGGYRPNVHDNVQYPLPSTRSDPWQQNTDKPANYPPSKTLDSRIEKFDIPRVSEHLRMGDVEPKRSRSGTRDSRSPVRRDRSPFKDRYRRHSPSPRSPRRSWALEKRRSPLIGEAPPPPVWPGQNRDPEFARQNRPMFSDVPDKMDKKHAPTWERPVYEDKNEALRHDKGPDTFARNNPTHSEKWKPVSSSKELPRDNFRQDDRFPENARDSHNYGAKEQFERQGASERMQYTDKRDFRDYPMKKDDRDDLRQKKDVPLRRDDFSRGDENRREIFRTNPAELNKEIEDVYKRVAELGKKAQEYRKKESRFEDRGEFFDQNEETMQRSRDRRDYVPDDRYQGDKEDRSRQTDDVDKPVRQRESRWSNTDKVWRPRPPLSSPAKANRERAAEELARRIMNKFKTDISESQKARVSDELQLTLKRIFYDMFKTEDVSYIELVIRFNKKFDVNDEKKIFEDVMSSFSSNYRKRAAPDQPDIPAKTSKRSPDNLIKDEPKGIEFNNVPPPVTQEWKLNVVPTVNLMNPVNSSAAVPPVAPLNMQMPFFMNPPPVMVPPPSFVPTFELPPHQAGLMPNQQSSGFNLYLCKDNFQAFENYQAEELKSYLVSKMIEESETSRGWAPDFIMKGLQSVYRYEIVTQDERSKDWLLNLDFSYFHSFNVLVYTDEELWYERAAIWLPGHSRCRHIEPLHKLKLQNKKLDGVNIGKWKFVKKVITVKGTRIYVDLPPSSTRALEKYKMMISYELQKVSVFLKAMAVDKDVFDAGLNEPSVEIVPSMHYTAMPSLGQDVNVVKIGIKGNKHANVAMTRKIKDMIVYQLYQYLLQGGNSSTDFLKYGFCSPGYLGIIPENTESRRWLVGLHIGTLNRQPIIVVGADDNYMKYIKMYIMLPNEHNLVNCALACEKLKQSNQGVKGLKFGAWKNARLCDSYDGKTKLEVQMDLDSVESIAKLNYELDYVDDRQDCLSVVVKSDYSYAKLNELIKQYRAEMTDTYDVANMDIASDSDDDVVCLN